jgi:catechol 2,3-dioxygenase-like lactoylglutathione lyase family enzyme
MTLAKCRIIAFVPTKNPARARTFYESRLGLRLLGDDQFAMVFEANGSILRVVKVVDFAPAPFTILGWDVPDVESVVRQLVAKRIARQRYKGMHQDRLGIWTSPSGSRVEWFKDPDGNLLSVSQQSR